MWYQRLTELFSDTSSTSSRPAYRTYSLGEVQTKVSIRENKVAISGGTTGLCSWPAGEALCSWIDVQGASWTGKKVLELGSGSGISGIFTARRWGNILQNIVLTGGTTMFAGLSSRLTTELSNILTQRKYGGNAR